MDWIENFSSSNVAAFAYDYDEGTLYVRFHNNSVYAYDVGEEVAEGMYNATSKGKFVWNHLRGHEIGRVD